MRNKKRIKKVLDKLESVWYLFPDWRLGQLLENIAGDKNADLFYLEDEKLMEQLEEILWHYDRD